MSGNIGTYDDGKTIEELFPDDTMNDHVIDSTGMWAGTKSPVESEEYLIDVDGNIVTDTIVYPPALYKCIDEAIVNAMDNLIRNRGTSGDNVVDHINIKFDKTGRITVRNNGRGVPVGMHKDAKMWSVQLIFGNMFKGRAKTDKSSKVTGDANRVGIKIANILSTEFTVKTLFRADEKSPAIEYSQVWHNNMRIVNPPVINESMSSAKQYTEVSFVPDYAGLFETEFTEDYYKSLDRLIRFRAYTTAAYVGFYTSGKCSVGYNDKIIDVKSISDLTIRMFPAGTKMFTHKLATKSEFPWEVCIAVVNNNATNKKNVSVLSNVNGINVKRGKHIDSINKQIVDGVREEIMRGIKSDIKFIPSYVYSNIHISLNCQIPGVEYDGQRKDEVIVTARQLVKYKLGKPFIKKISDGLREIILSMIYGKATVTGLEKVKKFEMDKYVGAKMSSKNPTACSLLCPEGDSAASMIANGITTKHPDTGKPMLGYDYYGYITLGGVIINIRKMIKMRTVNGVNVIELNSDIAKNKFFNTFLEATGLDVNAHYKPGTASYAKEIAELKYGAIIGCVDQDHDGSGFIFPLLCNIFEILWPELLKAGFLKKWDTPRRRAIPKVGGKILEFYSEYDFDEWRKIDPDGHSEVNYNIDYIKGLASHEEAAVNHMFKNFHKNVVTYYPDEHTSEAFEVMFGDDSKPRKVWLSTPIRIPSKEADIQRRIDKRASLTELIHNEGKEHALSNVNQKLWNAIDGMNESGRKILDTALSVFKSRDQKMKVVALQGYVMAYKHYQHGDASLQESILGKALLCVGGVQLPQLLPRANLGTRRMGGGCKGGDSGHPRYVSVSLNKRFTDIMYPSADYPNYTFVMEDGSRAEPEYFVPILPMAILESISIPAHGWKILTWARDVRSVIKAVRYLIRCYREGVSMKNVPISELDPEQKGFKGDFRIVRGVPQCFGNYMYDEKTRTLTITEIPLRKWTKKFTDALSAPREIKTPKGKTIGISRGKSNLLIFEGTGESRRVKHDVKIIQGKPVDHSGKGTVRIELKLAPVDKATGIDPYEHIMSCCDGIYADGFEVYFELYQHLHHNLSMIATDKSVITFDQYEDVLRYWFPVRKHFYEMRVRRELEILKLKIKMTQNIIRYIDEYKELAITGKLTGIAESILMQRDYDRFHKTWLNSNGYRNDIDEYIKTEDLSKQIMNSSRASYDYLLSTTDRAKLKEANDKRSAELDTLIERHDAIIEASKNEVFVGATMWLDELDKLEKVIDEGFASDWTFGFNKKFKY